LLKIEIYSLGELKGNRGTPLILATIRLESVKSGAIWDSWSEKQRKHPVLGVREDDPQGVLFRGSLLSSRHVYPNSILGALLGIRGLELSLVATDQTERGPATVMLVTASAVLALNSTSPGFVIGRALALLINRLPKHEHQLSH